MIVFLWISLLLPFSSLSKLLQVIEVIRHGAREPLSMLYNGKELLDIWGELTTVGMREHFLLGRQLREKYINQEKLLQPFFDPSEVYIRSTDVNRTIVSAISHLMGLYDVSHPQESEREEEIFLSASGPRREKNGGGWMSIYFPPIFENNKNFIGDNGFSHKIRPFPIHTVNRSQDLLLRNYGYCRGAREQYKKVGEGKTEESKLFMQDFKETLAITKLFLNETNIKFWEMPSFEDTMISNEFKGLTNLSVEGKLSKEFRHNLTFLFNVRPFVFYSDEELNRAMNAPLSEFIQKRFASTIELGGVAKEKFILLSAHDTTLQQIIAGFNITNWKCMYEMFKQQREKLLAKDFEGVKQLLNAERDNCEYNFTGYASHILLELHRGEDGNHFVKFILNGREKKICEGKNDCAWEAFKEKLLHHQRVNHREICPRPAEEKQSPFSDNVNPSEFGFIKIEDGSAPIIGGLLKNNNNHENEILVDISLFVGIFLEAFVIIFLVKILMREYSKKKRGSDYANREQIVYNFDDTN